MVESFSPFTLDIAPYVIRNGCSSFDIGLEVTVKTIKDTRIKANMFSFPVVSHTLGGELLVGFRFKGIESQSIERLSILLMFET